MKLRWLRSGSESLRRHIAFITTDNPSAATQVRRKIRAAVLRLADFPQSGRPGHISGTRELVVPGLPYIVVYAIGRETVDIVRVFHTAMDWPAPMH